MSINEPKSISGRVNNDKRQRIDPASDYSNHLLEIFDKLSRQEKIKIISLGLQLSKNQQSKFRFRMTEFERREQDLRIYLTKTTIKIGSWFIIGVLVSAAIVFSTNIDVRTSVIKWREQYWEIFLNMFVK